MSAPIAHLLISQEGNKTFFSDKNHTHIYIGTSFPDIRHLVGAKREITHYTPKFLQDSPDFLLGMDLHNWMDEARAAYRTFMVTDIYREVAPLLFVPTSINDLAVKFFEDEVAVSLIQDKSKFIDALNTFCNDEENFAFSDESLKIWHRNVRSYIEHFGDESDEKFKHMINSNKEEVYVEMLPLLKEYRENKIYREFVEKMLDYILVAFRLEMSRRFTLTA